jgi:hypothetical protein
MKVLSEENQVYNGGQIRLQESYIFYNNEGIIKKTGQIGSDVAVLQPQNYLLKGIRERRSRRL